MTKTELIEKMVSERPKDFPSKAAAARTANAVFEIIKEAVASGDVVSIGGFGTFKAVDRGERTARNPQTGEEIVVPAHKVPKFKAGSEFKARVAE